jgi:hypothetical protein
MAVMVIFHRQTQKNAKEIDKKIILCVLRDFCGELLGVLLFSLSSIDWKFCFAPTGLSGSGTDEKNDDS